ncbi:MAG: GGDEF domain-containing protein [Arenicella sp.]
MKHHFNQEELYRLPAEATHKMLMRLALVAIFIILPFAVYNFIFGNYILAVAVSTIVAIFTFNAWTISRHKRYYSGLTFWFLVPTIIFFLAVSIYIQGVPGLLWGYAAILGFYCMLPEKKAYIANSVLLLVILPIAWIYVDHYIAVRATATMLLVFIFSGIFVNLLNEQQRKLQEKAITDPLTTLFNRSVLEDTLKQAIEQNHRAQIPMTIAIFDLDHFKKVNDLHGHHIGDRVLQEVAKLLKDRCRKVDRIFRLGGEEFLVFLYNTGSTDAVHIAEELRARIENLDTLPDVKITASVGLASLREDESWQEWMNRSDQNQYEAKLRGRNRIVM